MNIKLDENDKKILTEIMEGNIKDKLLNGTLDSVGKRLNRLSKKIEIKNVHLIRRLHYKEINAHETLNKISEIAKNQNHSISSADRFYI